MRIDVEDEGEVTIVRPEDRLDMVGYLELEELLSRLIQRGRRRLVLDLQEATFINSGSMGVLGRFWADCARAGGVLVVARPGREVRNILRIGQMDRLIEVFPRLDEAVRAAAGPAKSGAPGIG